MKFNLSFNKEVIKKDEKAKVIFIFESDLNQRKLIHILSYQFFTYYEEELLKNFMPHEYVFDLKIKDRYESAFSEVNLAEYFGELKKGGIYNLTVRIKYLVCGEHKAKIVDGKASIYID